ncbi:hypothetical protein OMP38_14595 [Cohnella ginsengisoli]|uniref:Uncharacterized protein n=1 Tax=Cohnella ginsengisoli TaxID=425004 RepID=A0A9X4QN03_9BACL|nr:hypothetical protein [Cohnella ginsengisoli]MDG0791946.1 hypothetical protein [Cohnella ginsengisoli]
MSDDTHINLDTIRQEVKEPLGSWADRQEMLLYLLDQLDEYKVHFDAATHAGWQTAEHSVHLGLALEAAEAHNALLQAQLDAKDTEIKAYKEAAELIRKDYDFAELAFAGKDAQIAERDATIARQTAEIKVLKHAAQAAERSVDEYHAITMEQAKELGELEAKLSLKEPNT